MSDAQAASPTNNHTLAYLRRLDQRHSQLLDMLIRQQELISRFDRDVREAFSALQREMRDGFQRVDRDNKEIESDLVVAENKILYRMSDQYESSVRPNDRDDRLAALEAKLSGGLPG